MQNQNNLSIHLIENLRISSLYERIFGRFELSRDFLYEKIKHEKFIPYSALKIRRCRHKRTFAVVCGAGRHDVLRRFAGEIRYPEKWMLETRCEEVADDDESCVALILSEALDTKRVYKKESCERISYQLEKSKFKITGRLCGARCNFKCRIRTHAAVDHR